MKRPDKFCLALLLLAAWAVAGQAAATTSTYSLSYGQQTAGAVSGRSLSYSVESTVKVVASQQQSQTTGDYSVENVLAPIIYANNGLATGQGTIIRVSWDVAGAPPDRRGFEVYRQNLTTGGGYVKLTASPVTGAVYLDGGVAPNTAYVYRIRVVGADSQSDFWTQTNAEITGDFVEMTAVKIRWHLLGREYLSAEELQSADVNQDGKVDVADFITLIKQKE